VTVVAGDRLFLGIRQDVSIAMSGDALFAQDSMSIRATMRVAGLLVAEPSSVQIIRAAAA
jgi:hypothetical protein